MKDVGARMRTRCLPAPASRAASCRSGLACRTVDDVDFVEEGGEPGDAMAGDEGFAKARLLCWVDGVVVGSPYTGELFVAGGEDETAAE
jgi:hypothetical protein